ncbi:MAG TPA: YdeI/OmpD-associated family protein [Thermoanaerobaculia bacterium]
MAKIEFEAELWAAMEGKGWTFVTLPKNASEALPGRGRVPVQGTINGFAFRSSVFPDGKGSHQMMVNGDMRTGGGVGQGDTARFVLEPASDEVAVEVPPDLEAALAADPAARERFDAVTPKARAEWVAWIEGAQQQATRERRLAKTLERLLAGKKRPSD